jgi:uncharacterized membrane protein YgcG
VERVYAEIEAISKEEGPENPSFFLETKEIKHYSSSRRIEEKKREGSHLTFVPLRSIEERKFSLNSNKGKEINVVLYNDPSSIVDASSTPDEIDPKTGVVKRTININLAHVKTEKDLMMALFHESYDPAKHGKNERLAENYASHIERTWDTIMYGRENRSLDILDKIDTTEANKSVRELEQKDNLMYSVNKEVFAGVMKELATELVEKRSEIAEKAAKKAGDIVINIAKNTAKNTTLIALGGLVGGPGGALAVGLVIHVKGACYTVKAIVDDSKELKVVLEEAKSDGFTAENVKKVGAAFAPIVVDGVTFFYQAKAITKDASDIKKYKNKGTDRSKDKGTNDGEKSNKPKDSESESGKSDGGGSGKSGNNGSEGGKSGNNGGENSGSGNLHDRDGTEIHNEVLDGEYTDKVNRQRTNEPGGFHDFNSIIDNYAGKGEESLIPRHEEGTHRVIGYDKLIRVKGKMTDKNGKIREGTFEWIINHDDGKINHRFFNEDKK